MQVIFNNLAYSTLAGSITNTALTLNLQSGGGALFPNPSSGQYFTLTLVDAATGLLDEIMWCTARTGDTLTVIRAQEGTTALAWNAGDIASNKITAGSLNLFVQAGAITQASLVHYGVATGTNTLTATVTPAISALTDGTFLEIRPSSGNTGAVTLNPNGIGAANVVNRDGTALASGAIVASQPFQLMALGGQLVLMTQAASSTIPQAALVHYGVTVGTNTLTTTVTPAISALADGTLLELTPGSSNTGAVTINPNGVGYVPLLFPNGGTMTSGTLVAGQPIMAMALGGNLILMNAQPFSNGPGVGIGQWAFSQLTSTIGNSPAAWNFIVGVTTTSGANLIAGNFPFTTLPSSYTQGLNSGYWASSAINGTPSGTWLLIGWFVTQSTTINPQFTLIWQRIA